MHTAPAEAINTDIADVEDADQAVGNGQ
jgi:hypothetical protein